MEHQTLAINAASNSTALHRHDRRACREKRKDTLQAAEGLLQLMTTRNSDEINDASRTLDSEHYEQFDVVGIAEDLPATTVNREEELEQQLNAACQKDQHFEMTIKRQQEIINSRELNEK